MDQFHHDSDHSRGAAWQIPRLTLPRARFLLMSATLAQSDQRPVPLEFEYSTTQLQEKVAELNEQGRPPVSLVHFTLRFAFKPKSSCAAGTVESNHRH